MIRNVLKLVFQFITGWAVTLFWLLVLVSLSMGALHLAAWFALLGETPEFPWFIWRLFVALSAMFSLMGGCLALDGGGDKEVV